ncbi:MAG: hypothetical protein NC200_01640 [Candidatus Gastranaerophilales bacterium]|nr:hypothetical protein [Candidatus Gastranaerophilales bacterium]
MIKTVSDSSLLNEHNRIDDVSWFTNISSCIWLSKVTNILKDAIDNKEDSNRCINILNEQVRIISSYRITDVERYRVIFDNYTNKYLNDSIGAEEQFITDCTENNISRYFNVKYIGNKRQKAQGGNKNPKNIIMDFKADFFAQITGRIEDIPLYPTCYCHYFMIAFLLDIINSAGITLPQYSKDESFYKNFLGILFEKLNSSVLTGLEAFAEYELDYPYDCIYGELRKLTSLYQDKLVFYATPHNKSFEVTIKEYSLVTKMFVKYRGVWSDKDVGRIISNLPSKSRKYQIKHQDVMHINSDREHDKVQGVFSKLRITEGTNENRMRVYLTLSGQRIINRIFDSSSNVNGNVKAHRIIDYIPSTAYMIAFMLWIVLNCTVEANNKFQNLEYSNIPVFCQYIDEYLESKGKKQPRNVVVNTAISIMLSSKTKEEQEEFINSHFSKSQSQQKALIRAGINRINEIKQQVPDNVIPFTERLIKELENAYNW